MIKISEATAIALHSIIYISGKGDKVTSLKEIAEKFKISEHHLSKVLQRLVKEGVITSAKGPKGGFLIVPEHKDMTFMELYEIMEGKLKKHSCLFASNPYSCQSCIMGGLVDKIHNEFVDYMQCNKVSDFSL